MSTNLSKQKRDDLVKKIKAIRKYIASATPDENTGALLGYIAELEKEIKTKKYGLVFEEHRETIDETLETRVPVLNEQKDLFVDNGGNGGQMNFLIEGDNLAALQLLQKTHKGKIDMIYIDPPYNTGNKDFIYDDDYIEKEDTFRHSKWMSFMNKRLRLAKILLTTSGVVFISVDDNEQANLKLLCEAIFGSDNIEMMIWHKVDNDSGKLKITYRFRIEHEYILAVYKNKNLCRHFNKFKQKRNYKNTYTNPDNDPRGAYKQGIISDTEEKSNKKSENYYAVTTPSGRSVERKWRFSQEEFQRLNADNRIYYGKTGDSIPAEKVFINEEGDATPVSILENLGTAKIAGRELLDVFDGEKVFSYPKPVVLIKHLLNVVTNKNYTILDFFAGSGTTGHAVLELNNDDGGTRQFILCTNNENNICRDVTYERIKRVIKNENYPASLKYYKIDFVPIFVPISEQIYYEYADTLLLHIRELVELENGINFAGNPKVAIVLTDSEVSAFFKDIETKKACRKLYIGHDLLLTGEQEDVLKKRRIALAIIPEYYYRDLEA